MILIPSTEIVCLTDWCDFKRHLVVLDPSAVVDSWISRQIFVRRKNSSQQKLTPKCSAEYQPEKNWPVHIHICFVHDNYKFAFE